MIVKNRGKLVRIGNDDRNVTVEVHTKNDKQMTELLEDISQKAKYGVYTETIVLQGKDDSVVYDSNISVEVR